VRTPLADLTKLVAGLMVERYGMRYRELVLAAIYGLTIGTLSTMLPTQPAKKGVDDVFLFRGLIVVAPQKFNFSASAMTKLPSIRGPGCL
jgi:hypothetical protein